jgi:hypothetical protein
MKPRWERFLTFLVAIIVAFLAGFGFALKVMMGAGKIP